MLQNLVCVWEGVLIDCESWYVSDFNVDVWRPFWLLILFAEGGVPVMEGRRSCHFYFMILPSQYHEVQKKQLFDIICIYWQ